MEWIEGLNRIVWGVPTLLLIAGVGVVLTICTRFAQFRFLRRAFKYFLCSNHNIESKDGYSPFRALCTALAATVGTGNLAGIAGAIAIGGPGAVFWIWVGGLLGMITKCAEATLAVHYRVRDAHGNYLGGPMYVITRGLPDKYRILAVIYALFGVIAAFGVGNATQINTLIGGINSAVSYCGYVPTTDGNILIGIFCGILVAVLLFGGAKRIGAAAESLVPFASVIYIILGFGVLILRFDAIPAALSAIFQGAFTPGAATGGMIGSAFITMRIGASRGVFTNEAGMGTAGIAHAGAAVSHPVQQGLMGIIEVFIDTLVICTVTAMVILCSGVPIHYGNDVGIILTSQAFASVYGSWVTVLLSAILCCFAFATILGWGLYGIRCAQFLFGKKIGSVYVIAQAATVVLGAVLETKTIWLLAETVNGLMAIPNLIAIICLLPVVKELITDYEKKKE
ncbi:MAG: sodium:alanine symporter family protein [Ruminococcaceae bacterium]|nr:sodium:alanine symporter family protein [Oscillospiraceae bacterium]